MQMNLQTTSSRRRFVATAGAAMAFGRQLFAKSDGRGIVETMLAAAAKAKIQVVPVRRNISVLDGSGGNIAVLTGKDGKLLVDAGHTASRSEIARTLASVGHERINRLVNTHWHTDHTDGNAWLREADAAIIAHENTRRRMSVPTRVEEWDHTFPAAPIEALPATSFRDRQRLHINDTEIGLNYYGRAHTGSDISVHFTEADVLHVGDTWSNGIYPFIDRSIGGSIDGQIRPAEANIAAATPKTIIIPGHGAPGSRSDLVEFRDMLVSIREGVASLKKQRRSLADVIAAKPTTAHDAKWGQFLINPRFFTTLVYQGV
jgi:glyoxylase-like metal-dependent hydrolase (beta-lactamase superfamily II)